MQQSRKERPLTQSHGRAVHGGASWNCSSASPQRSARIAIIHQHLVEELRSECLDGPMKQVSVARRQVPPPPPLERMHQRHVEDERRQPLHFRVSVRTEGFEAPDIFRGDMALG